MISSLGFALWSLDDVSSTMDSAKDSVVERAAKLCKSIENTFNLALILLSGFHDVTLLAGDPGGICLLGTDDVSSTWDSMRRIRLCSVSFAVDSMQRIRSEGVQ